MKITKSKLKNIKVLAADGKGGTCELTKEVFAEIKIGNHLFYFTQNLTWNERTGNPHFVFVLTHSETTKKIPKIEGKTKPECLRQIKKYYVSEQALSNLIDKSLKSNSYR